ncbi:molybdenum cofactor guanylyltransferase [Paenibacillus albidus]|uniref:Probable molybdenum cofactor guanylyltransferase n=1 Tax=Paenibacillus albidus TaxID=2041023 RepID=A0A917FKP6_9BACL|nr:molybdenum cofactor guanylyltransferase [Paenibacillus albidus]GGF87056.1 molybdenum cofactor guanylyltransferase [Paenibacillus albidus]
MKITGIILAGGHSRRMGADKALLELGGVPLISHLAARLSIVANSVCIACGAEEREAYRFLRLPLIPDRYPGQGPLAGLHAALWRSNTEWNVAAACDLPFASREIMQYMIGIAAAASYIDAVVPVNAAGKVQPLLAVYHSRLLPSLEDALERKRPRVMEWLDARKVHYIHEHEFPGSPQARAAALLNMNTPEDYQAAIKLASSFPKG